MNISPICGIDPGSTNGALCVISRKKVSFVAIGSPMECYMEHIEPLLEEFNVKTFCIEQILPYVQQRGGAGMLARIAPLLKHNGECRYFIIKNSGDPSYSFYEPTAAVWKKYLGMKRFITNPKSEKIAALVMREMYETCCNKLKLHGEYVSCVEVFDSFFLALYAIDKHNGVTTCKEILDEYYEKTFSKGRGAKAKFDENQSGRKGEATRDY